MTWSTRTVALAALRTQMQDDGAPQRYSDAELGIALDQAVAALSEARPLVATVLVTVPANHAVRLDTELTAALFGSIVLVRDVTAANAIESVAGWSYYEAQGGHYVLLPSSLPAGNTVEVVVRGGYGFDLSATIGGAATAIDTNVPVEWRELLLDGAEGFALELYGKREVGRTNVPPAVAQQTARAAAVLLRDFRQRLLALPFADVQRQIVAWNLQAVDGRTSAHRGFD